MELDESKLKNVAFLLQKVRQGSKILGCMSYDDNKFLM